MWGCKPVCCINKGAKAEFEVHIEHTALSLDAPQCLPTPTPSEELSDTEQPQYADQPPTPPHLEQPKDIEEPQCKEESAPRSQRVIVFTTPDSYDVKVTFAKEPFEIAFNANLPIKVLRVKGHAEKLGVQPGWVFKSIDGSPVQGMDFKTLKSELVALGTSVKESPYVEVPKSASPPPVVVFATPDGKDVAITFTKAPIGITFNDKEFPIKTDKVKGHAEALGVQPGWLFKSIGGSPVEGKDFGTVKAELEAISQSMGA